MPPCRANVVSFIHDNHHQLLPDLLGRLQSEVNYPVGCQL